MDGVLDFYVLVDDLTAWPQGLPWRWLASLAGANVEYRELHGRTGRTLRAKIAVHARRPVPRAARLFSLDTTVWRGSPARRPGVEPGRMRPARRPWPRSAAAVTAGLLGGPAGAVRARARPRSFWDALFRQETYAARTTRRACRAR